MCGIVAAITKGRTGFSRENQDVFEFLLWVDTLRGDDSTGMFMVTKDGNVKIAKGTPEGTEFVRSDEYRKLKGDAWTQGWAMVGHNRKATRGKVNEENAHPFWVDDRLVLVHNGSYNGSHKHLKDTEVDSEAIAHVLADCNGDYEAALRKVNAAYALIWYDVHNKKLNIIRNKERPLSFLETNDSIYFASEGWMLGAAAARYGIKGVMHGGYNQLKPLNLNTLILHDNFETEVENRDLDCEYKYIHVNQGRVGTQHSFRQGGDPRNVFACGWESCAELDEYGYPINTDTETDKAATRTAEAIIAQANAVLAANSEQEAEARATQKGEKIKETDVFGDRKTMLPLKSVMFQRIVETVGDNILEVPFRDFNRLKGLYSGDDPSNLQARKVRCNIIDVIEPNKEDAQYDRVFLVGRPLDNNKIYVSFPLTQKEFDALPSLNDDAVFEFEVDSTNWARRATSKMHGSTTMDDWEGVMVVHGKNAKPVTLKEAGNGHQVH